MVTRRKQIRDFDNWQLNTGSTVVQFLTHPPLEALMTTAELFHRAHYVEGIGKEQQLW